MVEEKIEVQWMSLALIGDRNGIWPQKQTLHQLHYPSPPSFLLSEQDIWIGVKERWGIKGNQVTQVQWKDGC